MKKQAIFIFMAGLMLVAAFGCPSVTMAEPGDFLTLPAPQTEGGKSLLQALKDRRSSREFAPKALPMQVLSDLLWAADGVNRPGSGKRTAPSARDRREIDVYVALQDGLYRYDAEKHGLLLVLKEDVRALTGKQEFVATAPLNLIYVADFSRAAGDTDLEKAQYAGADTGFISQNVYLFCASQGLGTVVRGYVDKPALEKKMGLPPGRKVVLAQTVGYPGK